MGKLGFGLLSVGALFFILPFGVNAADSFAPYVVTHDREGNLVDSFRVLDKNFTGGISIASGDTDNDGRIETIVATGPGRVPRVTIWEADHLEWNWFPVFDGKTAVGLNIAAGDVDGDDRADIIVSQKEGGTSTVEIYQVSDDKISKRSSFCAFSCSQSAGVTLSAGDLDGDGDAEIVAGAEDGSMQVRQFNVENGRDVLFTGDSFNAFDGQRQGGVFTAVVDRGEEYNPQIVLIEAHNNSFDDVMARFYEKDGTWTEEEFLPYGHNYHGGVSISAGDLNQDGRDELAVVPAGSGAHVKILTTDGALQHEFFSFPEAYRGGSAVTIAPATDISTGKVLTVPLSGFYLHTGYKSIMVDLGEQKMHTYEGIREVNSFLISSGVNGRNTPTGTTAVQRKVYSKLYQGTEPGDEYYFSNTLYNLQFRPGFYLHGAYWHNNFGHPMSHGCINIAYDNAEWLYNWAEVGTPVKIQD